MFLAWGIEEGCKNITVCGVVCRNFKERYIKEGENINAYPWCKKRGRLTKRRTVCKYADVDDVLYKLIFREDYINAT
jgi:hypothetical protein